MKIYKIFMLALMVSIVLVLSVGTISFAGSPTIEETVTFINNTLEYYSGCLDTSSNVRVHINDCIITVSYDVGSVDWKYIANLKDLNPESAKLKDDYTLSNKYACTKVWIYTTNNEKTVKDIGYNKKEKIDKDNTNYFIIPAIRDKNQAEKIMKATQFLVNQCGGKGDIF
ncbi:MAG: hypothetical protein HQK96_09810 [Nitrospirae bacterium]|nr:hypothetical protein [Nitrospirota bacterium]